MTTEKFEPTLELATDDLATRREQLQAELKKTVIELVTTGVKEMLKDELVKFGVDPSKVESVSWDFYYESDDEGGTNPYLESLNINMVDGEEELDMDELTTEKKYSWSGNTYEANLREELYELFHDFSDDLHRYDIYEIEIN